MLEYSLLLSLSSLESLVFLPKKSLIVSFLQLGLAFLYCLKEFGQKFQSGFVQIFI
jgi:hypothetical protein